MKERKKGTHTILEPDDNEISDKGGLSKIISNLNSLYKKDKLNKKFEDLGSLKPVNDHPVREVLLQFLFDFYYAYNKLRRHGTTISKDLLSIKLFKAANISRHHEQLIQAA